MWREAGFNCNSLAGPETPHHHTTHTVRTMNCGVSAGDSGEPATEGGASDAHAQLGDVHVVESHVYQEGPMPASFDQLG